MNTLILLLKCGGVYGDPGYEVYGNCYNSDFQICVKIYFNCGGSCNQCIWPFKS